ncbi:MAG: DUF167 domain-containing protein [Phycisphaerales bacterium]
MIPFRIDPDGHILIPIKAVPGASRDQIVGLLGDRLKVRISTAPQDGKANRAIERLLARGLGIKSAMVTIIEGMTSAEKTVRIEGLTPEQIGERLALDNPLR